MRASKSIGLFISLIVLLPSAAMSQTVWAGLTTYGGSSFEWTFGMDIYSDRIVQTIFSNSFQAVPGTGVDFIVLVNNRAGGSFWETVIGKPDTNEWTYDVSFLTDGNPVAVGVSCVPNSGSGTNCIYPGRGFIIKMDRNTGNIIFSKMVQDAWGYWDEWVRFFDVEGTSDGGFVVAGEVVYDGSVGDDDAIVMKFDADGNLQWYRIFGTSDAEWAMSIFEVADGNLILITPMHTYIWFGKLDSSDGSIIWQKSYQRDIYGSSKYFSWAYPTSDGGFVLADEISGGSSRDMLFVKFDSNGNVVSSFQLGTTGNGNDMGIDIVEGTDYYYFTGAIRGYDVPVVYVRKSLNIPERVRYILSGGDEQGRAIDISVTDTTEVPYVAGYTDNSAWVAGSYDGLLAADSGLLDTCYWRTAVDTYWTSVSLSPSLDFWSDYGTSGVIISNTTYYQASINTTNSVTCGILTPLQSDETYNDCRLYINIRRNLLTIKAKAWQDIHLSIYTVSGKKVLEKSYHSTPVINEKLHLKPGIYIVRVNDLKKKFVVK